MEQHLPKIYLAFREAHPEVAKALDDLGRSTEHAGPLDARTQRLVKLALAVGSLAEGAVRSNARKALDAGDTAAEIRHVALLAITTCGFPTAIAGLGWVDEVLGPESAHDPDHAEE
jgi:4-carboxymuconolactone decarboxylase